MTLFTHSPPYFFTAAHHHENSLPVIQEGVKQHIALKPYQKITLYGLCTTLNTINITFVEDMNSFLWRSFKSSVKFITKIILPKLYYLVAGSLIRNREIFLSADKSVLC